MKQAALPHLPRGMGTYAYRKPDKTGKQQIQYQKVVGNEENKKRLTVYGDTVQEVNKKMVAAERKYLSECKEKKLHDPHTSSLPLKIAVLEWMEQFKQPQIKSKSYDTIEGIYDRYLKPAEFATKQIEQVRDVDVQTWLTDINSRLSDSTTKKCFSLLNQFFKYYYIKRPYDSPMLTVSLPVKDNKVKLDDEGIPVPPNEGEQILDDDEIKRFEQEASRPLSPGKIGYKHGLLLVFAMWTYARDGELIALQWRDIDLENKRVYIYKDYSYVKDRADGSEGKKKWELNVAKTKAGIRYVYLCDFAVAAIMEYKKRTCPDADDRDFIFVTDYGNPVPNQFLNNLLAKVLARAGIDKDIPFHGLRHTGISYFRRHDADPDIIAKMAGHASREITDRIYYQITDKQFIKEIEKINQSR